MNITNDSKIYVVTLPYLKTGGTELAHQLVHELNVQGKAACIVYYGKLNRLDSPLNTDFTRYVGSYQTLSEIYDSEKNVLIVPETLTELLSKFKSIQKCIWWMSVDNYLWTHDLSYSISKFGVARTLYHIVRGDLKVQLKRFGDNIIHFYQSEYAHQFLLENGYSNCYRLSDYLSSNYFQHFHENIREDRVLYNPKKGKEFTNKLIEACPEIEWIPIQGMSTDEVQNILQKSKVYIDFGNHPGKDRFPREAAISGCCVIVDKKGSAAYYDDVPIPDEYKVEDGKANVPYILSLIQSCFKDYEIRKNDFLIYQNMIRQEYKLFEMDVADIFNGNIKDQSV